MLDTPSFKMPPIETAPIEAPAMVNSAPLAPTGGNIPTPWENPFIGSAQAGTLPPDQLLRDGMNGFLADTQQPQPEPVQEAAPEPAPQSPSGLKFALNGTGGLTFGSLAPPKSPEAPQGGLEAVEQQMQNLLSMQGQVQTAADRKAWNGAWTALKQKRDFHMSLAPDDGTASQQDYNFYVADEKQRGNNAPMSFQEWSVSDEKAGNPNNQFTQPTTPGQEATDKAYAKEYVEWTQGGGADMAGQISQITSIADRLESGKENLTGAVIGNLPDAIGAVTNPSAVDARETVESVVQRNLRILLGAQFTAKEGEQLISRAYNPRLDETQNATRLVTLHFSSLKFVEFRGRTTAVIYGQN